MNFIIQCGPEILAALLMLAALDEFTLKEALW